MAGPLGPERGDWQAAQIAHALACVFSQSKRQPRLADFVLKWAPIWKTQNPKEAEMLLTGWLRLAEGAGAKKGHK